MLRQTSKISNDADTAMRRMLNPRSIALIGASSDETKVGGRALASMRINGFAGKLFPVNPKVREIGGLHCYASIDEIDEPIDLAVISVPADQVVRAVEQCAARAVAGVVIYTAGFAELDAGGKALQDRLSAIAHESGMRILGPNSLGLVNFRTRTIATFHGVFSQKLQPPSRLAVVSQSGAFLGLVAMTGHERQMGFSHLVTTGNECDLEVADFIGHIADDPDTDVVLCYLETCRDGDKLKKALAKAQRNGKKIVCIKVGRTEAGARAAQSHTAAIAGDDAVYDALFRQYGVYRANSFEEYFDVGMAAAVAPRLQNSNVCVVSISGGIGIMMADEGAGRGLVLANIPETVKARMRTLIPFAAPNNPLDVTAMALMDVDLFSQAICAVLETRRYGSIAVYYGGALVNPAQLQIQLAAWRDIRARFPDVVCAVTGMLSMDALRDFQELGVLAYREPTDAMRVLAALHGLATYPLSRELSLPPGGDGLPARPAAPGNEPECLAWLKAHGVPVPCYAVAASAEEAVAAADALGYPVAVKVVADGVIHKSDVGGVSLGIANADGVRHQFDAITGRVAKVCAAGSLRGCLVMPMAKDGVDVVVGVTRDPSFGPVVMFGLGGVFVEVLKDVTFRIAPFDKKEALRMIGEVRGSALLRGARGRPLADVDALAEVLCALSIAAIRADGAIASFEINPLRVLPQGHGVVALDAVVEYR
jgi:acyl-CoA synthetase (NDP forming)